MTESLHPHHDFEAVVTSDVSRALDEDIRDGDLTASLIPAHKSAQARVMTRVDGVLAGPEWFNRCFTSLDPDAEIFWHAKDGEAVSADQQLCEIQGNARALLSAERTAINFLQTLSAVATKTRFFVDAVSDTDARILDTRKTLPGLRMALKYAVRAGGGHNHRIGLFDGILIKDNHILAAGSIGAALDAARALVAHGAPRDTMIEIEVESLAQLDEALACGATLILLDNFGLTEMRKAVRHAARRAELEASGGITLESVHKIAKTGVDRISVGALTKDIEALDLSLRFKLH
jgi:nicotinate-nucleotide pyrophosphorylase (carboxylating)